MISHTFSLHTYIRSLARYILIIFLICSPLQGGIYSAFAIDTSQSARIIDAFKDYEVDMIFVKNGFGTGTESVFAAEYQMRGLQGLRDRMANTQTQYIQQNTQIGTQIRTLEDTIAELDKNILSLTDDIATTDASIHTKELSIATYQLDMRKARMQVVQNKEVILQYLSHIYDSGNMVYDASQDIDMVRTIILTDDLSSDVFADIEYKSILSGMGQTLVEEYRKNIRQYYRMTVLLADDIAALDTMKSHQIANKTELENTKKARTELLETTKGQQKIYEQYIRAAQRDIEKAEVDRKASELLYTKKLDSVMRANGCDIASAVPTPACTKTRNIYESEKYLSTLSVSTGTHILQWPVSTTRISAYFNDPEYRDVLGSDHNAIDIPVPQGTPIYAPADGYVSYMLPPTARGYAYFAVRHAGGYTTVYGHVSEISVRPYQFVRTGDYLGKTGGAVGTPGAGPMTSGAHLHYEVYKDQVTVDPLQYMSIASLPYETLPAKYREKYIADIAAKYGTGVDKSTYKTKFFLSGNTESARQKSLLSQYATKDFQDQDMWIDTAIDANLDPSFLMCIGLAESTLGNHLKTAYNVGNIGNTDSGGTYTFDSAAEGTYWMGRTLNNKYLGGYTRISQLSRWGNADGAIYASSPVNWHNNLVKCLSALKGEYVGDEFQFRLR